ncbi:MAG: hypothetical protein K2Q18_07590, partial [Bdellovibrionales bacterium]|nr:hypothetical protein [Bdellovibrionales bacterium]
MEDFSRFISQLKNDPSLSQLIFFKDHRKNYSYEDLIESAQKIAYELQNSKNHFFALQMNSSYKLIVHLLAGLLAKKRMVILSPKEPPHSVMSYKLSLGFDEVIYDDSLPEMTALPIGNIQDSEILLSILSSGSSGPSKEIALSVKNVMSSSFSVINF